MNELTVIYNAIAEQPDALSNAKQIYAICRTITPAFYKKQTLQEMKADVTSIALLIQEIRPDILAKMCELAVKNYGRARAKNDRVFFDINYILTFYDEAWDRARPDNMSWIARIEKIDGRIVVTYCNFADVGADGKLKDGAPCWSDER